MEVALSTPRESLVFVVHFFQAAEVGKSSRKYICKLRSPLLCHANAI